LDNKFVLQSEIDSIISLDIYNLRLKAIKRVLDLEIIKMEAKNQNLSLDSFLSLNFQTKCDSNKSNDNNITLNYNSFENTYDIQNSNSILNQLRKKHRMEIFLPPPMVKFQTLKKLYSYIWDAPNAKETIIVIFNYDCPICSIDDTGIKQISKNYNFNLQYIYYTEFVTNYALLCDAAVKQKKYWEMHDRIISSGYIEKKDLLFFADSIGIDTIKLKMDSRDKKIIKNHLTNRDIIQSMNIYSLPTYIYRNSIFHDIKTLELFLQAQ